jgi:hypothetical protein
MQRLFSSPDLIRVAQLKDVLEAECISCVIKNENLSGIAGEVPFAETFPELWIQNDSELTRAVSIKAEWKTPSEPLGEVWICPIAVSNQTHNLHPAGNVERQSQDHLRDPYHEKE